MSEFPLPSAFIQQMHLLLGAETDAFLATYAQPAYRALRFRDARRPLPETELRGSIPYAVHGYFLAGDSKAGLSPLHEAGAYYIQEPSAMAAAAALAPRDDDRVLDLCAAPGGKSTQLAMSARLSLLVANEPIPSRAQILSRNIERMGITNAIVTCAYPDTLAMKWPCFFDKILVDAPCSGEGMFRRHPETRAEWSPEAPVRCAERQLAILRAAARMLRPGGRLAYSTCTFNNVENEGTIHAFLREFPSFHLVPFAFNGLPAAPEGMLRLWPHKTPGEGHFVALLEKEDGCAKAPPSSLQLSQPDRASREAFAAFAAEMGLPASIAVNALFANHLVLPPQVLPPLDKLRVLRLGLHLGEMRGKTFLPDHALALAVPMQRQFALDEAQSAAYLHGETLPCAEQLRSFFALTFCGYQLGFGKASDGQMKNHYPKGLRK